MCSCTRVGYTSEASVHWVSQDDPSLLVDLTILLLDVPCNVLYTLCGGGRGGRERNREPRDRGRGRLCQQHEDNGRCHEPIRNK